MKAFDPTLSHDPEPERLLVPSAAYIERRARLEYEFRNNDFIDDLNRAFGLLVTAGIGLMFLCFAVWLGRTMQENNAQQYKTVQTMLREKP